ncbi:hypothetical protein BDN71DRAFT_1438997 [Pleurotus eryngii]|uniref:Uncharacterized protein n=1 Tax=Pleurotus eryngii TaxID=5323 RepID=A0A9P6DCA5_PLEER|nr:hypothetical protein BDN71DRAFT_1438997 [Pleurotus eryngii]
MRMENIHDLGKAISSHPYAHFGDYEILLTPGYCRQSIEIIPGDLDIWRAPNLTTPFLLVDGHLGVPQKLLYKLYVTAQTIFYSTRREQRTPTIYSELVDITAIILLANPAHQTALHERKKLVEARVIRACDELELLGLLQATKSHAKESILWAHRRWLLNEVEDSGIGQISCDILRQEFTAVFRAAEVYPRNYYAWSHWRFCVDAVLDTLTVGITDDHLHLLLEQYDQLCLWTEQHISDYSAAHHLTNLVALVCRLNGGLGASTESRISPALAFDHVTTLLSRYPSRESLWTCVRTIVQLESDESTRKKMIESQRQLSSANNSWSRLSLAWISQLPTASDARGTFLCAKSCPPVTSSTS